MAGSLRLNEDEKTFERIFRTLGALERLRVLELQRVGLSLLEAGVLYFLKVSPHPLTPAKISRLMHKPPHTISVLLRNMESRGLVNRTTDTDGRKAVMVSLTNKGEATLQLQLSESTSRNITAGLSREQVAMLNTVLRQLHDAAVKLTQEIKATPYNDAPF